MATATSTPSKHSAAKKPAPPVAAKSAAAKAPKVPKADPKSEGKGAARPQADAPSAPPKLKLVRDSFTIPKSEYAVLDELKQRAAGLTRPTKKSELLRAGIAALQRMPDKAFLAAVNAVPSLKTGRPGNAKSDETAAVAKKN